MEITFSEKWKKNQNKGTIFSVEDIKYINNFCEFFDIDIRYDWWPLKMPYWRQYREFCILSKQYNSDGRNYGNMKWIESKVIKAGSAWHSDRIFHFVLCSRPYQVSPEIMSPPEPHLIGEFVLEARILIELLNDDGIRNPDAIKKILQYGKVLHQLKDFAVRRIATKYHDIKEQNEDQLFLWNETLDIKA